MNVDRLAAMRPGAYLINTARGPLLDYAALVAALKRGHLAGAPFRTLTVATETTAEELRRFLAGEPPLDPC